ncbi:MAG: hypothetical protein RIS47_2168, partial [Bacteroidota bacterium]
MSRNNLFIFIADYKGFCILRSLVNITREFVYNPNSLDKMEVKKSPKADLEKNRLTFSLIGLAVTLAIIYGAFEYSFSESKVNTMAVNDAVIEDEIVQVTTQNQAPPPPPPPPPAAPAEVLEVVDNKTKDIIPDQKFEDAKKEAKVEIHKFVVEQEEEEVQEPFMIVEKMPNFPGGVGELMKYIGKNVKYPNVARENGIQGRIFVRFVVNKDGTVGKVSVVRPVD